MITKEDVLKVARLSKFKLKEEEIEMFREQLNNIIKVVEQLKSINTKDVEPLYSPLEVSNHFRQDVVKDCEISEDIIKSSEYSRGNVIVTPKVVG
ncbi:MAG TPA: Asp-tRNA(Asn)/Glu-tRNA(Gln) amidotransferase GatCAB subunit C [Fusobacteria bacterium]|nr:Asp-tRNA(Asn)/Glu-tRNA(Gln) amidotransferase GatCAB subunit C [Fusobacteriota bacterium]|tara:strand:+ start:1199 stop:1483 length:285 start_codon:yes stop_codon:yes gene_type:complete